MIRSLVQLTLDNALYPKGVYSFWQRKTEVDEHNEYIVYTTTDIDEFFADDEPLVKSAEVTVRYFYRSGMAETEAGRQVVDDRKKLIMRSMKKAGFDCPFGAFDAGDIDNNGYFATIFEFEYKEVANGY